MKIGISCYPTYGGSGVIATELGKNLARRGIEVHFISYSLPYRLTEYHENIFYHEVKVPEYPLFEFPPYALALATKMADICVFEKLDILHVHYAIPHAISAYLAKEMVEDTCPVKIITTLHGTDITLVGADPSFLRITRFGIEKSDAVTAVSEFLKNRTINTFHPKKEIRVIYNFIEEHPMQNHICENLKNRLAPNNEFILLHMSNFRSVKRVLDLIDIASIVKKEMPVKLVMIGDGPDRPLTEKKARDLGLSEDVIFLGKQENIYAVLNIGDVFLMPSRSESFGLAALEAMSCGVPCVTSDAEGLKEVNLHNVTGYLAPVGDVQKMAQYTIKILKDPELKRQLAENARKHAMEHFHADKIVPQYLSLYREVLGKSN